MCGEVCWGLVSSLGLPPHRRYPVFGCSSTENHILDGISGITRQGRGTMASGAEGMGTEAGEEARCLSVQPLWRGPLPSFSLDLGLLWNNCFQQYLSLLPDMR